MTIPPSAGALGAPRPTASAPSPQPVPPPREPALWTMLSQAERAFFDLPSVAGPLSYGPAGAPTEAPPALGQNLDIRA